jgi:hypothetical protein
VSEQHHPLQILAERLVEDRSFAERLVRSPRAVAAEIGVTLDDEQVRALSSMSASEAIEFASEYRSATDPSKRRAAC